MSIQSQQEVILLWCKMDSTTLVSQFDTAFAMDVVDWGACASSSVFSSERIVQWQHTTFQVISWRAKMDLSCGESSVALLPVLSH